MALIYLIRNRINQKVYVGQHIGDRLQTRWLVHIWNAKHRSTHPLHRAIRKYGENAFEVSALSISAKSKQDLDQQEIFFISQFLSTDPQRGYNLAEGGWGNSGFKHRAETKKRIGDSNRGVTRGLGHIVTPETRDKISKSNQGISRNKGCKKSQATKDRIRQAKLNISEETRSKLRITALAREARKRLALAASA
jgi:group I intron endonuclease